MPSAATIWQQFFIIPKIKSYLICESQVALFVLLIFARLLLQFFYQHITQFLGWDDLITLPSKSV